MLAQSSLTHSIDSQIASMASGPEDDYLSRLACEFLAGANDLLCDPLDGGDDGLRDSLPHPAAALQVGSSQDDRP